MNKRIHASQLQDLALSAGQSARGRAHLNTHDSLDADVQRLFIATAPTTYMRPHRHREAYKWEFFLVIEGELDLLVFADNGEILERCRMSPTGTRAVEIPPGNWHTYVCRRPGTLAFEVKQGAYVPTEICDYASWSPAEGSAGSVNFLAWMQTAAVGDAPP